MQSLAARRFTQAFASSRRSFATSPTRFLAEPTKKPVLLKEFKIYRWVCVSELQQIEYSPDVLQNPDEPAQKPTLQSYTIDLNQSGPMVRVSLPFFGRPGFIFHFRFWTL